jgi:L-seryl-tRNA(Ser) seleniumtransferase
VLTRARELLAALDQPSLRPVINATGVIVHTNLGRAPLPASARDAVARAAEGYSNLELDLATGERGSRDAHVEGLLTELTGADAALVVNNGAAAVLLAAAALAGAGRAIVVSRGQLVEIGGGFRIPEVIAQSGARMVEVGTTNRTRLEDYEQAVARNKDQLGAVLRVHPSNFRSVGFVQDVLVEELCGLGVPVIDDVGSGVLAGAAGIPALADEPALTQSIAAGAALVCCSGDKLLGGPQAGLLVGRAEAVAAARRHPLARALRIDKLSLAALEATLMLYRDPQRARDEIPVLSMLDCDEQALSARARRLADAIGAETEIVRSTAKVGGGALPLLELEGPAVALRGAGRPEAIMRALRDGDPPVIARIHDGEVLLDPRTLADSQIEATAAAARRALNATR